MTILFIEEDYSEYAGVILWNDLEQFLRNTVTYFINGRRPRTHVCCEIIFRRISLVLIAIFLN